MIDDSLFIAIINENGQNIISLTKLTIDVDEKCLSNICDLGMFYILNKKNNRRHLVFN